MEHLDVRRNRYILIISERYQKMVKTIPMKTESAEEVARYFNNEWVMNFGTPVEVLSDKGSSFTSKFFLDFFRILNVWNVLNTTYHPKTNG